MRGHITRTWFKLRGDTPVGDPAILIPRIYEPRPYPTAVIRYFTHYDNLEAPRIGYGEVLSTRMDPFVAIDAIVASQFVFTEALHVAILAHAYGIPWAWSLNKHSRGMVKWYDWFSSIDVSGKCFAFSDIADAQRWYDKYGRRAAPIDTDRLVAAFPSHIASR